MKPRWHLNFPPWEVQTEALRRSAGKERYGYFLEQGLGKTAVALNDYIEHDDIDLCIVVAPQSFKLDWPIACEEYGLGFLQTGYWPKHPLPHDWENGLYALNYEAVSRSGAKVPLQRLMDDRRCMLVIDESKALGTPKSGFTRSVLELAKRAVMVRELNGTPITQNVMDYYGQLRALGELNSWDPVTFRNRFAELGGFMGKQITTNIRNGAELARILDRCTFRALKADWRKDLPPKIYSTVHLEMTKKQQAHYREMMEEFFTIIDGSEIAAEIVLTQMGKLRQISSGIMIDGDKTHRLIKTEDNPKITALPDIIGEYGKSIVIYFHTASGEDILAYLTKKGFHPAHIKGSMRPEAIKEQKDRFNNDPKCRVIVGQERATALGHTLLGKPGKDRCNKTIFYENSFSLYYRLQLEDRNHRGAQDQDCDVIDLSVSPMDDLTIEILKGKREMADSMDRIVAAVRAERDKLFNRGRQ